MSDAAPIAQEDDVASHLRHLRKARQQTDALPPPIVTPTTSTFPPLLPELGQPSDAKAGALSGGQGAAGLKAARGLAGQPQLVPIPEFETVAGVTEQAVAPRPLLTRIRSMLKQQASRRPGRGEARTASDTESSSLKQNSALHGEASNTLSALLSQSQRDLEEKLGQNYDPLEQYALLRSVRELVSEGADTEEKTVALERVDNMLSSLASKHREALRNGLIGGQAIDGALAHMSQRSGVDLGAARELRFLYGAARRNNGQAPLTPYALASSLEKKFGPENFQSALSNMRSAMTSDLRTGAPQKLSGPRLWLSLADASAFCLVQSCFSLTGELRSDLVNRVKIIPRASHSAMTLTVLSLGDKGKGGNLVGDIMDPRTSSTQMLADVCTAILGVVRNLPSSLWKERPEQRWEIIDELQRYVLAATRAMPRETMPIERREQEWRRELLQKAIGTGNPVRG